MKVVTEKDALGNDYLAYEGFTKDGDRVIIDKDIAEISGDPEEVMRDTIRQMEQAKVA